jgi:hypothetical protein
MKPKLINAIQRREAVLAIGPSTLRGQGRSGVVAATRDFLKKLDLRRFSVDRETVFRRRLDKATDELRQSLP